MARINKYPLDNEINEKDLLVGTDKNDFNKTKNYRLLDLKDWFLTQFNIPNKTSDLTNDGENGNSTYIETNELGTVAFSNNYNDLINLPAYINYFDFISNLTTTISNSNTWVKLNTNTTSLFSRDGLVHTNNRVTNTSLTKVFKIEGIVSVSSGNNNEVHAAFFKNGQLYPCSEQETVTAPSGRSSAVPFHCVIELNTNDYIEVWVKNKNNSNNIILDNINVIVSEL